MDVADEAQQTQNRDDDEPGFKPVGMPAEMGEKDRKWQGAGQGGTDEADKPHLQEPGHEADGVIGEGGGEADDGRVVCARGKWHR